MSLMYQLHRKTSALVKVMAWYLSGIKPLPKPMMMNNNDAIKWHQRNNGLDSYLITNAKC